MNLTSWRILLMYTFIIYSQVTADNQVTLPNVTNSSDDWFGWSEENSLNYSFWIVCDDAIVLNTACLSCSSGDGALDQSQYYALLSPPYMILADNCNITISYTLQVEITIEVILRFSDNNVTIDTLNGTINERQTAALPISKPIAQLILRVTSNLNETGELLSVDNVNLSDCSIAVTTTVPVESVPAMRIESTTVGLLLTSINSFASPTATRMFSLSMSPQVPSSSSTMIISFPTSLLTTSPILFPTSMTTNMVSANPSTSLELSVLPTTSFSSLINTMDIVSVASSLLHSSSLPVNINTTAMLTRLATSSIQSLNNTLVMMTVKTPSPSNTNNMLPSTTILPPSPTASDGGTNFFTTNVIVGMAAGGGTLFLILLCLLICCLCRCCIIRRKNQHKKYLVSNNTRYKNDHKGHSSVYAQDRYRHKSRSVESMTGPYQYELPPYVHVESAPEAYMAHTINGDEDTIDSESEDICRDLRGTPTSGHRESQLVTAADHKPAMTSFYPQAEAAEHQWSDYNSDTDETNSDIVYTNKSFVNETYAEELPPILSLGEYEDDENIVITNPYNATFYSESDHIPSKDISPRRTATGKSNIDFGALTTLESSGEYTPKESVPNYQRKQSRYAAAKNHKAALRKTKSELNLEDATKIAGNVRYPRHQSKSRIDLKEATKLNHSNVARANNHQSKSHHSSTPKILNTSSKLERLTSLDT